MHRSLLDGIAVFSVKCLLYHLSMLSPRKRGGGGGGGVGHGVGILTFS